jgi:hypothetical protein
MDESIPPALQPPVAVALAKLVKTFPGPGALPGGMWAEPKWDGFLHWTSSRARSMDMAHTVQTRTLPALIIPMAGKSSAALSADVAPTTTVGDVAKFLYVDVDHPLLVCRARTSSTTVWTYGAA